MQSIDEWRYKAADAAEIKSKAKRLRGHFGYRSCDIEDVEQELATHLVQRMDQYVPDRGSRGAFVGRVVKYRILNLIEARTAAKRDGRRSVSINRAGECALIDVSCDDVDLRIDVQSALSYLPEDLRVVALLRMEHREKEIADLLGLTRARVRWRMRQLEKALRAAGLAPDSSGL